MTIEEVEGAEKKNVEGEYNYIVKILNQKSTKSGVPALVVFASEEFKALNIYIQELPDKLGTHNNSILNKTKYYRK